MSCCQEWKIERKMKWKLAINGGTKGMYELLSLLGLSSGQKGWPWGSLSEFSILPDIFPTYKAPGSMN